MGLLKTFIFVFFFLTVGSLSAQGNWEFLGKNKNGMSSFIDRTGIEILRENKKEKFVRAEFLFSFDEVYILTVSGKKYRVRSVVREVIIDCPTGKMMPAYDYYYPDTLPGTASYIHRYEPSSDQVVAVNKKSRAYTSVCPFYL